MTGPDLVVDVDLVVRRGGTTTRLRARHALRGQTVRAVATDGERVEVSCFEVSDWPARLTRACAVGAPPTGSSPAPDGPGLPWDLVVGTGAALSGDRPDLYDELIARDARFGEPVRRLHASLGRLRVVGIVPGRRCIGWISWVLQADGWRVLTPYVERGPDGARRMIRLEPRRPEDLPHEIGRWAALVR
ncbi:hypothetical protein [Nocardioides sp.]|uniref:hypothetical protein n=1 Tax=Nocardioides sp. TaxID=35761 RepID=UPI002F3F92A3